MIGRSDQIGRCLLAAAVLVLASCAPATPTPAAPTAAPKAAPTAAPKPAATTAPAAAKPTAPVAPAAPKAAELTTLNVGLVVNMNYVPVFVGVERGIFNKHGLDVKVKFLASGPEASKALEAGDVDVGAANMSTHITARGAGAKLMGFYLVQNDATTQNDDDTIAIIVPPNSPVQKVADLAGKRVARTSAGAHDPYLQLHLQQAGVDPTKLEMLNVLQPNMAAALKGGGIDAGVFSEPNGEMYLDEVPGSRVLVRGGGKVTFKILATAREEWLPKNQPIVEKFAAGLAESSQYTRQHSSESADIAARWLSGLKPEIARKAIRHYKYDPRLSKPVTAAWEQENQTLLDQKRIKERLPLSGSVDTTLLETIAQKYPQFFSDLTALPK